MISSCTPGAQRMRSIARQWRHRRGNSVCLDPLPVPAMALTGTHLRLPLYKNTPALIPDSMQTMCLQV